MIKSLYYSIRGMNKESYFPTPVGWIRCKDDKIELEENGKNPFDRPVKYANNEEKQIELKEVGYNIFEKPFEYLKYGENIYI